MKQRCVNPRSNGYHLYGAKGIKVCDEWLNSFDAFRDWAMSNGYVDGLSIDRKNSAGNYEPSNCRWTSAKVQANNTNRNRYITYAGETHTLAEWAEIKGLTQSALRHRLERGWSLENALNSKEAE